MTESQGDRRTYELVPAGPEVSAHAASPAARTSGELVGALVSGAACTWLAHPGGQLVLMMWPRGFRARFDPLELLDQRGEVVARGGETVTVGGGYLKRSDSRSLGYAEAFAGQPLSAVAPSR